MPGPFPIDPRRLSRHALALSRHESPNGKPLRTWLRRSTSASYYAVFHAVATRVARHLAPSSAPEDQYRLARSVDHARVAEIAAWVSRTSGGRPNVAPIVARLRLNDDLADFARIFVRLQDARHAADYDHLTRVTKASATTAYREALRALDLLDDLDGTADLQEFLALVALNTSLR